MNDSMPADGVPTLPDGGLPAPPPAALAKPKVKINIASRFSNIFGLDR
jgi:hypothetical protein